MGTESVTYPDGLKVQVSVPVVKTIKSYGDTERSHVQRHADQRLQEEDRRHAHLDRHGRRQQRPVR